jgi:hypothetical protein
MADLGAIAKWYDREMLGYLDGAMALPNYAITGRIQDALRQDGTLSGTVTANGVPVTDAVVYVFWRSTMRLAGRSGTDRNGAWSVSGLSPDSSNYLVIAKDAAGGTQYNDVVYSLVTPVAA